MDASVKHPQKVRKKLERGQYEPHLYLITLSSTPGNMLEIFSSIFLRENLFLAACQPVVGLAAGKKQAIRLVARIMEETYLYRQDYRADLFLSSPGQPPVKRA